LKNKKVKKKRNKVTLQRVVKWFIIALFCMLLVAGIIAKIHHFYSVHAR